MEKFEHGSAPVMGRSVRPRVRFGVAFSRREASELFNGVRDPPQRRAEVREVNESSAS